MRWAADFAFYTLTINMSKRKQSIIAPSFFTQPKCQAFKTIKHFQTMRVLNIQHKSSSLYKMSALYGKKMNSHEKKMGCYWIKCQNAGKEEQSSRWLHNLRQVIKHNWCMIIHVKAFSNSLHLTHHITWKPSQLQRLIVTHWFVWQE